MMIIFRGGFIVVNTSLLVVHSNSATILTYFTTQLIHTGTAQQSDQPASLIFRSSSDPNWISCCWPAWSHFLLYPCTFNLSVAAVDLLMNVYSNDQGRFTFIILSGTHAYTLLNYIMVFTWHSTYLHTFAKWDAEQYILFRLRLKFSFY